jgi:hypothetical protein
MRAGPEGAVRQIVASGGEADDILRASVAALVEEDVVWAGIAFLEDGELVLGPSAGLADESRRTRVPILFQGAPVGELWVDGRAERTKLEDVATLVAPYVLIGWDTGGEVWEP